ncbi:phage tail protein [Cupriavidus sp. AcVe19-6a]|uniref:phage tail protein n=1 Tax=Cupriavidus sp. AcVe19-6a TaxID=2821358 RepID=UPI001AE437B7|nr:phage tail protein [Cupriavidus sp. AcVe19-6a]MBP0634918.1 tail fiber protein [Cupriavidus sp. AcVe19-6a]
MAADFGKPILTDDYASVLAMIRDNDAALATWLDDATPDGTPLGAKRWSTANARFEKFDGSAWQELAALFEINVRKLQGYEPGNGDGQIPISNGTVCVNLNAAMLEGHPADYFATVQALNDLKTYVDNLVKGSQSVGQIAYFPAKNYNPAKFLPLNGAMLSRTSYPELFQYAQLSNLVTTEATWADTAWQGWFTWGSDGTNFRIPDLRGLFLRAWTFGAQRYDPDNWSRDSGWTQGSNNIWHQHGGRTDDQGWHGHHGWTGANGQHSHGVGGDQPMQPVGAWSYRDSGGSWSRGSTADGNHQHEFNTDGAGTHFHWYTTDGAGANESKPYNVAYPLYIRYAA